MKHPQRVTCVFCYYGLNMKSATITGLGTKKKIGQRKQSAKTWGIPFCCQIFDIANPAHNK